MSENHSLFGFPVFRDYKFTIRGTKFRIGKKGVRTLVLIRDLYIRAQHSQDLSWAIRCRGMIKEIDRTNQAAVLCLIVRCSNDDKLVRLAVWLLGRSGAKIGAQFVSVYRFHDSVLMRRVAARSLRRLQAWNFISSMRVSEKSPRVLAVLYQEIDRKRTFASRLKRYSSGVEQKKPIRTFDRRMYVNPDVEFVFTQPKSIEFIRHLLKRIRNVLAGSHTQS